MSFWWSHWIRRVFIKAFSLQLVSIPMPSSPLQLPESPFIPQLPASVLCQAFGVLPGKTEGDLCGDSESSFSTHLSPLQILPTVHPQTPVSNSSAQQVCHAALGLPLPMPQSRKCLQVQVSGTHFVCFLLSRTTVLLCPYFVQSLKTAVYTLADLHLLRMGQLVQSSTITLYWQDLEVSSLFLCTINNSFIYLYIHSASIFSLHF